MQKNYKTLWDELSRKTNYKDYIQPALNDDLFWESGRRQAQIINAMGFYEKESIVLDFGSGVGRVINHIDVAAENKIAVDVSKEFLKQTPPPIKTVLAHGTFIPEIDSKSIDFIYSLMVLQHIHLDDHKQILRQLVSFLKPNGLFLCQFPSENSGYYKKTKFVNTYSRQQINELVTSTCPGVKLNIFTGNLALYADNFQNCSPNQTREFFALIQNPA